jgi:hypothetical protein
MGIGYCAFIAAARMTFAHLSISAAKGLASFYGMLAIGVKPSGNELHAHLSGGDGLQKCDCTPCKAGGERPIAFADPMFSKVASARAQQVALLALPASIAARRSMLPPSASPLRS